MQAEGRQARQQVHHTQPRLARYQAFVSTFRRHIAALRAAAVSGGHGGSGGEGGGGEGESALVVVWNEGQEEVILFQINIVF